MPRKPRLNMVHLQADLCAILAAEGPRSAGSLRAELRISPSSFSRLTRQLGNQLLVIGKARATRYALRRAVPGLAATLPVFEVLADGSSRQLGELHGVAPQGFAAVGPVLGEAIFDDVPYYLHDLRPSGFLGRLLPRRHPELQLPEDIRLWSGEHCLRYLTRYGWNPSGNLIIGQQAFQLFLEYRLRPPDVLDAGSRATRYPQMAEEVLAHGVPGSSAAGEQPKLLANIRFDADVGLAPTAVLVKFSPPLDSKIGRRVADLLVCESLALKVLRSHGHAAAEATWLEAGGRMFLECLRFDRVCSHGRRGLVSLATLDAQFVATCGSWSTSVSALAAARQLPSGDVLRRVRWLELFGRLIANDDMHLGNLSFFTKGLQVLELAPAYDMTPMFFAPRHQQLVERSFVPPLPQAHDGDIWPTAWRAALEFWQQASRCPAISPGFRGIARQVRAAIHSLEPLGEVLPQ